MEQQSLDLGQCESAIVEVRGVRMLGVVTALLLARVVMMVMVGSLAELLEDILFLDMALGRTGGRPALVRQPSQTPGQRRRR